MNRVLKELLIFIGLLVILAPVQHPDLLTAPFERIGLLFGEDASQPLYHPLVWVAPVYLLTVVLRLVFNLIRRVFKKRNP